MCYKNCTQLCYKNLCCLNDKLQAIEFMCPLPLVFGLMRSFSWCCQVRVFKLASWPSGPADCQHRVSSELWPDNEGAKGGGPRDFWGERGIFIQKLLGRITWSRWTAGACTATPKENQIPRYCRSCVMALPADHGSNVNQRFYTRTPSCFCTTKKCFVSLYIRLHHHGIKP